MVEHRVVGFGGARCKNDLCGVAAEHCREFFARFVQGIVCARAEAVRTGRIADEFLACVNPGLPRFGKQRRRGIVIEINHAAISTGRGAGDEFFQSRLRTKFRGR